MNTQITEHAPLIYTPKFFDPNKAYQWYQPDYAGAMREGIEYAGKHGLISAQKLIMEGRASAAMLTDLQNDFRPNGRLPVIGTDDVILRSCVRLINGTVTDFFGGVIISKDGHPPNHISFDIYWRDQKGNPLDLRQRKAACLTLVDKSRAVFRAYGFDPDGSIVELGHFQAHYDPRDAVEYWQHLQDTGQGDIWVFDIHCLLTGDGSNIHPLLEETIAFMVGARSLQPTIIHKGHISNTDWFGPLEPCRPDPDHPQGSFNKEVIDEFKRFVSVEFSGVAEDFCDFYMKAQALAKLAGTEYSEKLRFVEDGTAPIIPNAAHVQKQNEEARKQGVKFIKHDTPFNESV